MSYPCDIKLNSATVSITECYDVSIGINGGTYYNKHIKYIPSNFKEYKDRGFCDEYVFDETMNIKLLNDLSVGDMGFRVIYEGIDNASVLFLTKTADMQYDATALLFFTRSSNRKYHKTFITSRKFIIDGLFNSIKIEDSTGILNL